MKIFNKGFSRLMVIFTVIVLLSFVIYTPVKAQLIPLNRIGEVERLIYGDINQNEDIRERIEELELTLYNQTQEGTLVNRAENIIDYVYYEDGRSTLVFLMNVMEWSLSKNIYTGSIIDRIERMEESLFDEITEDKGLVNRIDRLSGAILDGEELPAAKVTLPESTKFRIELLDTISSAEAEVGDIYEFEVVDDVVIDDILIIPEKVRGTVRINDVEKSGNLGKDGEIELELMDLIALDGTGITLNFDLEEVEENSFSREMAVGAGILSAVVLGHPLGLGVSYFVSGEEEEIPAGTRITVRPEGEETINGITYR